MVNYNKYSKKTDEVLGFANEKNEIYKLSEYIRRKFNSKLDEEDLKRFVVRLYKLGYTKETILSGKYDGEIKDELDFYENTKLSKGEEEKSVPLKVKKSSVPKVLVASTLAAIIAITAYFATEEIKYSNTINDVDEIILEKLNADGKNDIVYKNTYRLDNDKSNFAYDIDGMARDISIVCKDTPELFNACLNVTYEHIDLNTLENMDELMESLKKHTKTDESLETIYNAISDCDCFLDYLIKRGFLNPNDKDYYRTLEAIEAYKEAEGYNNLSKKDQKIIDEIIDDFKDSIFVEIAEYNYRMNNSTPTIEQEEVSHGRS